MIKIKVEGADGQKQYLELLPGISLEKTNDFFTFGDIVVGRSTSFTIPRTRNNERVLGLAGSEYEYGDEMRRQIPCQIQYGSIDKKGYLTLDSATETQYNCTLYMGYSDLLAYCDGRKLKDYSLRAKKLHWRASHAVWADSSTTEGMDFAIIPYVSEAPEELIEKNEWCWLPSMNIRRMIENCLDSARAATGDYDTRYYDLFTEVPDDIRKSQWMILKTLNGGDERGIKFKMHRQQSSSNITVGIIDYPVGVTDEGYDFTNDFFYGMGVMPNGNYGLNEQFRVFKCTHDLKLVVPNNFAYNDVILARPSIPYWNVPYIIQYYNLKTNDYCTGSTTNDESVLKPGDIITIPANTRFSFYKRSDLFWWGYEGMGGSWAFSHNYNSSNFEFEFTYIYDGEEVPEMRPWMGGDGPIYDPILNLPDCTLLDLCRIYGWMTRTCLTFEDGNLAFSRHAGYHQYEIKDCISFTNIGRCVGEWAVDEIVKFDSDDWVPEDKKISTTFHTDNLAMDQSSNDHTLKCSEGYSVIKKKYAGDGPFLPARSRLAFHDCEVEYNDDGSFNRIKLDAKKECFGRTWVWWLGTHTLLRAMAPSNDYYNDLVTTSTKVEAKFKMDIEDFYNLDHTWDLYYRGARYHWLSAKWSNGICEAILQHSNYQYLDEYYITVDYTNGGTAGSSGYAVAGTTYYVSATPQSGCTFEHWEDENGNILSTDPQYSFTVTGEAYLLAVFSGGSYEVTTESQPAAGGTTSGGGTYQYNDPCTVFATPADGYRFLYWTEGNRIVSYSQSYSFQVTRNIHLTAHFESLPTYRVSVSCEPSGVATQTGAGIYYAGTQCTVTTSLQVFIGNMNEPSQRSQNYLFIGWRDDSTGIIVSYSNSYTFTVEEDRWLTAVYKLPQGKVNLKVDVYPNGAGNVSGGGTYQSGDTVTVSCTPNQRGYVFSHWRDGGGTTVSTSNPYTFTITQDMELTAVCTGSENEYTVTTVVSPAGAGNITGGGTYLEGEQCTLWCREAYGYTFQGWYINNVCVSTGYDYTFTVTQNVTVEGRYTSSMYKVSAVANPTAGGTITGAGEYAGGSYVAVTATANNGYNFVNWTENGQVVGNSATFEINSITRNYNLVANFQGDKVNIQTKSSPVLGGQTSGGGSYYVGDSCTVIATPAKSYAFDHWEDANHTTVSTDATYTFTVDGDELLTAYFTSLTGRTISALVSPSGVATVTGTGTYYDGEKCTLTAKSKTSSQNSEADDLQSYYSQNAERIAVFSYWTLGGNIVSYDNPYSFEVNGDAEYTAVFNKKQFSVKTSVYPSNTGATIVGEGTVEYGQDATLTITPPAGWAVDHWEIDKQVLQRGGNSVTITVYGDTNVYVFLRDDMYSVNATVDPIGVGTVTGTGGYRYGETAVLTATPAQSYNFLNWTDENDVVVSTSPTYSFPVEDDVTLTAHFYKLVTVTTTVNPVGGGTATGAGQYMAGDTVTLTATPSTGYDFTGWFDMSDGTLVSTSATYQFTAADDIDLRCQFVSDEYLTIHVDSGSGGSHKLTFARVGTLNQDAIDSFEYSLNGGAWTHPDPANVWEFSVYTGDEFRIRTTAPFMKNTTTNNENGLQVRYRYGISVRGDISAIVDYRQGEITDLATDEISFQMLFGYSDTKVSDISNLKLPATRIGKWSYYAMFRSNGNYKVFTSLPIMPAITYAEEGSFSYMFWGCRSLTTLHIPELTGALPNQVFNNMYYGCTSAVGVDNGLQASLTGKDCCYCMFQGCTSLEEAPDIQGTDFGDRCCYQMFSSCTSLTAAPALNVQSFVSNSSSHFHYMFSGCTSLTDISAITSAGFYIYHQPTYDIRKQYMLYSWYGMFYGCTSLDSVIPFTAPSDVYIQGMPYMYYGCTALTDASDIDLRGGLIWHLPYMFYGCSSLTVPPKMDTELQVHGGGVQRMFCGCSALTTFPFTKLKASYMNGSPNYAYEGFFMNCTSLVNMPQLLIIQPYSSQQVTELTSLFEGCTSIVTAPNLRIDGGSGIGCLVRTYYGCTSLEEGGKIVGQAKRFLPKYTFYNCVNLNNLELSFQNWWSCKFNNIDNVLDVDFDNWVYGVGQSGTFHCRTSLPVEYGPNRIPTGWTVVNDVTDTPPQQSDDYITFVNNLSGVPARVVFNLNDTNARHTPEFSTNWEFSTDGGQTWTTAVVSSDGPNIYTTNADITLQNKGDSVKFRGNYPNGWNNDADPNHQYYTFRTWGSVSCCGKLNTLQDPTGQDTVIHQQYQFNWFMRYCQMTTPPDISVFTNTTNRCFTLFYQSSALASVPALPNITALSGGDFYGMFESCKWLRTAPALPFTTLADNCYASMFNGCDHLTTPPALPATVMAQYCYQGMFTMTGLNQIPDLSNVTQTARSCFYNMFGKCWNLGDLSSSILPSADMSIDSCAYMFSGSSVSKPPQMPATTLALQCYQGMYNSCRNITSLSGFVLPATTPANYCYQAMFANCRNMAIGPEIKLQSVGNYCCQTMFQNCSALSELKVHFTQWDSSTYGTTNWLSSVSSTGELICPAALPDERGNSRIPTNWTKTNLV